MHETNSFVTLTYNKENLPIDGSLQLRDWQQFCRNLRKKEGSSGTFIAGSTGTVSEDRITMPQYLAMTG